MTTVTFRPKQNSIRILLKPVTDARETRKRNLHEIEHTLFDERNISLQVGMTHVQVSRVHEFLVRVSRTCVMGLTKSKFYIKMNLSFQM